MSSARMRPAAARVSNCSVGGRTVDAWLTSRITHARAWSKLSAMVMTTPLTGAVEFGTVLLYSEYFDSADGRGAAGGLVHVDDYAVQFRAVAGGFHADGKLRQEFLEDDVLIYANDAVIRS